MRTYDVELIKPAVKHFLGDDNKIDVKHWISQPNNIALVNELGDLALFEKRGTWQCHIYFKSRGRQAINAGLKLLDEILNSCYNITVLTGLTPINNLGARWLSKKLGFKSQGILRIDNEPFEFFMLIKDNN